MSREIIKEIYDFGFKDGVSLSRSTFTILQKGEYEKKFLGREITIIGTILSVQKDFFRLHNSVALDYYVFYGSTETKNINFYINCNCISPHEWDLLLLKNNDLIEVTGTIISLNCDPPNKYYTDKHISSVDVQLSVKSLKKVENNWLDKTSLGITGFLDPDKKQQKEAMLEIEKADFAKKWEIEKAEEYRKTLMTVFFFILFWVIVAVCVMGLIILLLKATRT